MSRFLYETIEKYNHDVMKTYVYFLDCGIIFRIDIDEDGLLILKELA